MIKDLVDQLASWSNDKDQRFGLALRTSFHAHARTWSTILQSLSGEARQNWKEVCSSLSRASLGNTKDINALNGSGNSIALDRSWGFISTQFHILLNERMNAGIVKLELLELIGAKWMTYVADRVHGGFARDIDHELGQIFHTVTLRCDVGVVEQFFLKCLIARSNSAIFVVPFIALCLGQPIVLGLFVIVVALRFGEIMSECSLTVNLRVLF
jgi:hypothetical protein